MEFPQKASKNSKEQKFVPLESEEYIFEKSKSKDSLILEENDSKEQSPTNLENQLSNEDSKENKIALKQKRYQELEKKLIKKLTQMMIQMLNLRIKQKYTKSFSFIKNHMIETLNK